MAARSGLGCWGEEDERAVAGGNLTGSRMHRRCCSTVLEQASTVDGRGQMYGEGCAGMLVTRYFHIRCGFLCRSSQIA